MNSKNIKAHLSRKISDWLGSINDPHVRKVAEENTIVTGGALVSLLTGEPVHDYDIYFRTKEACEAVAKYYVEQWNATHQDKPVKLEVKDGRIKVYIQSSGVAEEDDIELNVDQTGEEKAIKQDSQEVQGTEEVKPKYRPVFMTSNAITLSDKIQIVTRFYGDVDEIHKNYDFVHCTCSYTSWNKEVQLPTKALECIINKELYYVGSRYPLCSVIRTRKYLERGYYINAGQYVKMAWQISKLDLSNIEVLEDQLCGVDTSYFMMLIEALRHKYVDEEGKAQPVDGAYVIELINRMF